MKKDISIKLSIWIGLAAIVICVITAGYSYQAYNSSQDIQRAHKKSLDTLRQEITRLEAKLTELGNELAERWNRIRLVDRVEDIARGPELCPERLR